MTISEYNIRKSSADERGFTLVELMISMLIGFIVIAAVSSVFITTLRSNTDAMNMMRLNQELRAIMTLVTRDIKRSGYWAGAPADYPATYNGLWPDQASWVATGFPYAYDADGDGVYETSEAFRFSWNGAGTPVTLNGQALTDPRVVQVTSFQFTVTCATCPGASVEIRDIDVVLNGRLVRDSTVSRRIQDTVRIRNDFRN